MSRLAAWLRLCSMNVRFGATILQVVPFPLLRDDFAFAESIGLDNAWVIDQFWIDEIPEMPLLEAWTTLAAVARETERIRIGAMVTNVATRNTAMLAKSILTVDRISGGRVEAAVRMATWEQLERAASEVFSRYRS
jgi:alkanesulfonate monooxygenase SsuD/methylene tetrahydromethanopterin reductase-like flavin-dependent oxidoreductase (luciferase family)